jgi:diguanylate cyclase (GGDEF)-like protein
MQGGDAYRIGGDETLAILPDADRTRAEEVAEKLRAAIETEFRTFDQRLESPPTVSIGVASFVERVPSDAAFKKVDDLLYQAKKGGKNQVASDTVCASGSTAWPTTACRENSRKPGKTACASRAA